MVGPTGNDFQDFCTMLGVMTLTWAWAENSLALAIGIIDGSIPQLRNHEEIPISLRRRLKYLRAALSDVPQLEQVKQIGTVLADDFARLSVSRHELIHGSTWQLENEGFDSLRFKVSGRQQTAHQKRFDIADTVRLNIEITKLSDNAAAFLVRVSEIFPSIPPAQPG